jgi:hydroxyacylglutathione hydrolase
VNGGEHPDQALGAHTTVLVGIDGGRYPAGNSVLVRGASGCVLIDPSTSLHLRDDLPVDVDRVLLTHVHEDHVAGLCLFPTAEVSAHRDDLHGIHSLDGLMSIYGLSPDVEAVFRPVVQREFHYTPRPEATPFADGDVFDLGGVTVTVVHLPGHTRGHCGFRIDPDGVFVLGDIDLSAFGPYYGDVWSDLDAFERSLALARTIDAAHYVTFHHRGVISDRTRYLELLDAFTAVIATREQAMVDYLRSRPSTLEELAEHRFVYRPHVSLPFVGSAERRSAELSLVRLVAAGRVIETLPGTFAAST